MNIASTKSQTPQLQKFSGEWKTQQLQDISDINSQNFSSSTDPDYKFNYISLEQVDAGKLLDYSEQVFRTAPSRARRILRNGDVLMSTVRPNLMAHLFFHHQIPNAACSTGFAVLRAKRNLSIPYFLFAQLFSKGVNDQITKILTGSNYPAINSSDVKLIEISCPPQLSEQRAIAEVLSDVDGLLNALDALIAKKRTIKHSVMQQLLTGKTRLPGFNGKWETKQVSEFGDIVTGATPSTKVNAFWDGPYPWITPTDITSERDMTVSERMITQEGLKAIRTLPSNTVLVTCIASIGKNAILKTTGSCNQQINAVTPNSAHNAEFLYYLFEINSNFLLANAGITATNIVSKSVFSKLVFEVPLLDEQIAIACILSDIDAEIAALEQRRDKTRAIKHGMMQQLLTGRVRLEKKKYTKTPYQKSPYFKTPQKCEKIWRYMHIDKFMAMLSEESLYFPNIYSFNDRYEGMLSNETLKEVYETDLLNAENTPVKQDKGFIRQQNITEKLRKIHNGYEMVEILNRLHSFQTLLTDFSNHLMFCSSWFLKGNESHSMWAEYGDKRNPTSVAIQTTIGDLIDSIESSDYQIHIGKIKYKNYNKEHIEGYENFLKKDLKNPDDVLKLFYAPILHKRNLYNDEKEVRAIISFESVCENYLDRIYTSDIPFYSDRLFKEDSQFFGTGQTNIMKDIPKGIPIKINLQTLLKAIVISPNVNEYFLEPFRKLIESHNIDPAIVCPSAI